jgi:ABC-type sugar transport system substrate-binding protein
MGGNGAVGDGQAIGVLTNGFNVYPRYLHSGVQKVLEGTSYGYIGRQSSFNSEREIANFQELIELGVAGIVVMPHKIESASVGYAAAKQAGIPVVNLLAYEEGPADDALVGKVRLPNSKDVLQVAQWITENTEPSDILLVPSVLGQGFSEAFTAKLETGLQEYGHGKWKIVASREGHYDRFKSMNATEAMLNEHPDAKIIIDYAAEMAIGIASLLKRQGRRPGDIVTITSDATEEMIPWMKDGWITATRFYSPAWHGMTGAKVLRDYLENGTTPDGIVDVPVADEVVTKDNLDAWVDRMPLCYDEYMATTARVP